MQRGTCKLCLLKGKDLQDSHLIPAGVFKSLRLDGEEALSLMAEKISQTSRRLKAPLLCRDCESRMNRGGETWVLAHMARQLPREAFPLYDLLDAAAVSRSEEGSRTYDTEQLRKINTSALANFALSMLWKLGIHDWKGLDGYTRRQKLGPYEEPIRQFLLGEGAFPSHSFVRINVWPDRSSVIYGTYLLRRHPEPRFHLFSFYIPGITFYLYVGKGVPPELREMCCYSSSKKPIFASAEAANQTSSLLQQLLARKRRTRPRLADS